MEEDISKEFEVYASFRKAQASVSGRAYRLPKEWEKHWNEKLSPEDREIIRKMKRYSITVWQNINLFEYFKCGFEIWKGFSYHKWFDPKIIKLYSAKDTNKKRNLEVNKKKILESAKFIKTFMKENQLKTLYQYSRLKEGFKSIPIEHYLKNYIDPGFLVYLIHKKYLIIDDNDRRLIYRIINEFREIRYNILNILDFLNYIEEKINKWNEKGEYLCQ